MKRLNYITSAEKTAYMKGRQAQHRARGMTPGERWMAARLPGKWTPQAIWGYRLFDLWSGAKGIAVELDGDTHHPGYDAYRDEYNFRRSAIVVLRVPNFDETAACVALAMIEHLGTWDERREELAPWEPRVEAPYPPSQLRPWLQARLSEVP